MAVLSRLLTPRDFGLQGMVLVATGFLSLFRDLGLTGATIQAPKISHAQLSNLFWINILIGCALTLVTGVSAPVFVKFYHEPLLIWIVVVSSLSFVVGAFGAQHLALLVREMRFRAIARINLVAMVSTTLVAVALAYLGYGYWALVTSALIPAAATSLAAWAAHPFRPSAPRRGTNIRGLVVFGGVLTLNNLVVYLGYNAEKLLLGRYWGAEALGLYGRAYQLIDQPLQQLHSSIYSVAFPALSRIQRDPEHLASSFLKGYSLLLSATLPLSLVSGLFGDEVVVLLFGPLWSDAGSVLRLLTPTTVVLAMFNPFGWFLIASGRGMRSLYIALVLAPVLVLGIWLGIPKGPSGVATGYSAAMVTLLAPMIWWAIRGTAITVPRYLRAVWRPALAASTAAAAGIAMKSPLEGFGPLSRLSVGLVGVGSVYLGVLMIFEENRELYRNLFRHVLAHSESTRTSAADRDTTPD